MLEHYHNRVESVAASVLIQGSVRAPWIHFSLPDEPVMTHVKQIIVRYTLLSQEIQKFPDPWVGVCFLFTTRWSLPASSTCSFRRNFGRSRTCWRLWVSTKPRDTLMGWTSTGMRWGTNLWAKHKKTNHLWVTNEQSSMTQKCSYLCSGFAPWWWVAVKKRMSALLQLLFIFFLGWGFVWELGAVL